MIIIKINESTAARRRAPVALVDDTDGKTAETGVTISAGDMKVSKNGAAEANHGGTLTELAGGDYYYEFAAGEVDTLGYLTGRIVKSGVRTFRIAAQVVAFDPYDATRMGLAALPNAAADAAGGLPISDAGGLDMDAILSRIGTPSNLGSGATVAANLVDIESQTDDIGVAGAGLTSIPYTGPSAAAVADAVWDEDATAHQTGGTFGQAIGDPGADANTIYGAVVTGADGATIAADIVAIDGIVDSILADTGAIEVDTQDIQARLPAALVGGRIDASVGAMQTDTLTSAALAASAVTEIQAGLSTHSAADVWAVGTRSLTDKASFTLAASEHTSIAAAVWAYVVEGAVTAVQWARVVLAAVAGKSNSHESGTPKYRDQADTKNRISATTDANGNRTSVTVDGT